MGRMGNSSARDNLTRNNIVAAARTMKGTPFHRKGRHPVHGVDCAGLLVCVARMVDYPHSDRLDYSFERPEGVKIREALQEHLTEKGLDAEWKEGDVVTFRSRPNGKRDGHLGILTWRHDIQAWGLVHVESESPRQVTEVTLGGKWVELLSSIWEFRGVTD